MGLRRRAQWLWCGALLWAVSTPAFAQQQAMETQLFLPTPTAGTTFTIERPELIRHLSFSAGLAVNGATEVFRRSDGNDIVPWRLDGELLLALGLFEWIELGLAAPITFASAEPDPFAADPEPETTVRPGDLRISAKVPILRGDVALSARVLLTVPTGDGERFLGHEAWSFTPGLVLAWRRGPFRLGAEAAYRLRQRNTVGAFEQDDELHFALGAAVRVHRVVELIAESQLRLGVGGRTWNRDENPMEVDGGVRLTFGQVSVDLGAGTGIIDGYGAPAIRGFGVLRWSSAREDCAAGPEDFDGYEDGDFCADPDNDGDGVEDDADLCPNDPEDMDDFLDADGCPDVDNDADGVADDTDQCPLQSEDRDGFRDEDGCPEADNDEDGINDGADQCPMEPEDRDAYEDEDGCPEPGPGDAVITVTDRRILVSERIYFDFGSETIRSVSLPLLNTVAGVIRDLRRRRVRVDGYTDSEGVDEYNLDLSYRRARAVVEYLVEQGVPRNRIEYRGYGEANPVAPNDSPDGRALNRRVEFTILEPGER
ncbi:MAG: OmpA family protein [Myxococcota bacterium]